MADDRAASVTEIRPLRVPKDRYDVAILGGGLAGLTLALQIKKLRPETDVLVAEKRDGPAPEAAFKVGESTVPAGAHYLSEVVGMTDHFETDQLVKCGLRFFAPAGDNSDITQRIEMGPPTYPPHPNYQIDRGRFENELASRARKAAVDLIQGCRVQDVALGDDQHTLTLSLNEETFTSSVRWVVDATGRASLLKRKLGIGKDVPHTVNSSWFRMRGGLDLEEWGKDDEAWMSKMFERGIRQYSTNHLLGEGYWVWLIPLQSGPISIGLCADPRYHPFEEMNELDRLLAWFGKHEPQLAEALKGREGDIEDFLRVEDFAFGCERVFSPERWCLVGEAGAFADPFYSPGSDFIGFGNTFTADLVTREVAGEDVTERVEYYNDFYLSTFDETLARYTDNYPLFGNSQVIPRKIVWDTVYVHVAPTLLFIQDKLTDLEFMSQVREDIDRMYRLNFRVQKLFQEMHELGLDQAAAQAPPAGPPKPLIDSFVAITTEYTDETLKEAIKHTADVVEAMAVSIFHTAAGRVSDPIDEDRQINPYAVTLNADTWGSDSLFDSGGITVKEARVLAEGIA